jgi:hypothetical protein
VKARSRINEHESQDGAEQIAAGDMERRTALSGIQIVGPEREERFSQLD